MRTGVAVGFVGRVGRIARADQLERRENIAKQDGNSCPQRRLIGWQAKSGSTSLMNYSPL